MLTNNYYKEQETGEYEAIAMHETKKALLCKIEGKKIWIPKSQICEESDVYRVGDSGSIFIPLWLAIEHGL